MTIGLSGGGFQNRSRAQLPRIPKDQQMASQPAFIRPGHHEEFGHLNQTPLVLGSQIVL